MKDFTRPTLEVLSSKAKLGCLLAEEARLLNLLREVRFAIKSRLCADNGLLISHLLKSREATLNLNKNKILNDGNFVPSKYEAPSDYIETITDERG